MGGIGRWRERRKYISGRPGREAKKNSILHRL